MGATKTASREDVIRYLLTRFSSLTKMQIMKLAYFADLEHMERYGTMLSEADYSRDHFGAVDYGFPDTATKMDDVNRTNTRNCFGTKEVDFSKNDSMVDSSDELPCSVVSVLDWVIKKYGHMSSSHLGALTKKTKPWRVSVESGSPTIDLTVCKNDKKKEYLAKVRASIDRSVIGTPRDIEKRNATIHREMLRYRTVCE